jgi:cytoskeletal protein CcmA (bactofilin family)
MNDLATRPSSRPKRLVIGAFAALLLALVAISVAAAQGDLGGKLRSGSDVRVPVDETVTSDLYVGAGTVTVDGTVEGDVVVTGGTLTLNGTVNGDVLAAGGTIRVGGTVAGDVRAAGGQVVVAGSVGEDGLLTGGQVELAAGGSIGEDLIVAGGQVTVAGDVTGSVTGAAGTYSRTGQVGGSDEVHIRQAESPFDRAPNLVADAIRHFLSVLLVGVIALWLAPRFMGVAEGAIRRRPLAAAGWGLGGILGFFLLLIVIPLVTVLVAILLGLLGFNGLLGIDILAGIVAVLGLVLAFGFVGFFLADAVLGLALALLVAPDRDRSATEGDAPTGIDPTTPAEGRSLLTGRNILLMAIGVAVIVIVTTLPVIGGILRFVFAILGLGAVMFALWWRTRRPQERTVKMETA